MLSSYLQGFAIGFSLILAIGAQNAFVLKQGLKQQHIFWICLLCALSDATLIALGVFGFAALMQQFPMMITIARYAGALFLMVMGRSILSRRCKPISLYSSMHNLNSRYGKYWESVWR